MFLYQQSIFLQTLRGRYHKYRKLCFYTEFSVIYCRLAIQQTFCVSHVKNIFHNLHIIYKWNKNRNVCANYNGYEFITVDVECI